MSRTENEFCRVHITVMMTPTFRANPLSYSKVCDTFRAAECTALRTDLGGKTFIDDLEPYLLRHRFVGQHRSERTPTRIQDGFRQLGFSQCGGLHVANENGPILANKAGRFLMQKVLAAMQPFTPPAAVGAREGGRRAGRR